MKGNNKDGHGRMLKGRITHELKENRIETSIRTQNKVE